MEVILLLIIPLMLFCFDAGLWVANHVHHAKQEEQTCDQQCWQQKMCTQPKYWHLPECSSEEPRP